MFVLIVLALPALLGLWLLTHRHNPTKLRVTVGVLLSLSFLLIGMNVQARWLFFLSGLLLASIALSSFISLSSLRGLEVHRRLPARVTEGDAAQVELSVSNPGRFSRRLVLLIERGFGGDGGRGGAAAVVRPEVPVPYTRDVRVFMPRLGAGSDQGLRVPRTFSVRGIFAGGTVTLQSGGWIGMASSARTLTVPAGVTVLPRYVEPARIPALEDFPANPLEPMDDRPGGSGLDFYGIREYRRGDPLRHVHWHSTARTGQLMVREFERQAGSLVNVLVINERGCDAGPAGDTLLDNAARIAASLLGYAARTGRPSRLAFARGDRMVLEDSGVFEAILDELAGLDDDGGLPPEELLRQAAGEMSAGSTLVVVMSSRVCDLASLAGVASSRLRVGLVILDTASFFSGTPPAGLFSPEALKEWERLPPPGFSFYLSFRKGDDLESCLQGSWIITNA